jgi:3-dehydroquinate dehydratase/shikimate dehydrogenase
MGTSLLCETVTGATTTELVAARDAAAADMVELRLDGVADLDVAQAIAGRHRPVIATCRAAWEGGRFSGSEEERRTVLARALAAGAEYADIEFEAVRQPSFDDLLTQHRSRLIVSSHDFGGVPTDLAARVNAMRSVGAAVIKVAVMANRLVDTLPLIEIARPGDAVVVGMGDAGIPSRLLASRFGSRWTYAGNGVAPGQVAATRMVDEFRFREIGPNTAIYGVVGSNAAHSMSPLMHNAAFRASGLDAVYVPLRAADFDDFLSFGAVMGLAGASITIPYKVEALNTARFTDELTRTVGAANTLRRHDGPWDAINTDVAGFLAPLDDMGIELAGQRVSVLGAGGAARAVVVALALRGADVTVHARRAEQAADVAASMGIRASSWPPAAGAWDMLVNCTPLGGASARDESPLPGGPFNGRLVYDLTYGVEPSRLLREAATAGCATLDGLPMLVAQAERQFEWWTGQRAPAGVMKHAADSYAHHNLRRVS